jgi:Mg2+ and Co2+ transporter CorA
MPEAAEPHRVRGVVKRAIAPLERRIEVAVTRAVETSMQHEIAALRESIRADLATLVELTYELERLARRIEDATSAAHASATPDTHAADR